MHACECIYIYTFIYMCAYIHIYAYACGGWRTALGIILRNAIHLLLKSELAINLQRPSSLHTPSAEDTGASHRAHLSMCVVGIQTQVLIHACSTVLYRSLHQL